MSPIPGRGRSAEADEPLGGARCGRALVMVRDGAWWCAVIQTDSSPESKNTIRPTTRAFLHPPYRHKLTNLTHSYLTSRQPSIPPNPITTTQHRQHGQSRCGVPNQYAHSVNSSLTKNTAVVAGAAGGIGQVSIVQPTVAHSSRIHSHLLTASVPPSQGLPARRQARPLRRRQHPRRGHRPFPHLLHRPDRGVPPCRRWPQEGLHWR